MSTSVILLPSTSGVANVTGEPVAADGWYNHVDGLHTVAIYLQNFKGRVLLEGSISPSPEEADWFPISLASSTHYLEFPLQPNLPSGKFGGDTGVYLFTFKKNVVWLRASVDRSYLPDPVENNEHIAQLGIIRKIILAR